MVISEYRSAASLAKHQTWVPDEPPGQGEAPVSIAGINVLIEWGPQTGAKPQGLSPAQVEAMNGLLDGPRPLHRAADGPVHDVPAGPGRLGVSRNRRRPRRPRASHRPSRRRSHRRSRARPHDHRRTSAARPATDQPGPRRGRRVRPRQADHRAPPGRRPPAVHPDRVRTRRVRGRRPRPDEPADRARDPPGRRRDRPAEARASTRWR